MSNTFVSFFFYFFISRSTYKIIVGVLINANRPGRYLYGTTDLFGDDGWKKKKLREIITGHSGDSCSTGRAASSVANYERES